MSGLRRKKEREVSNLLLVFLADPSVSVLALLLGSRSMAMVQPEEQLALGNDGKDQGGEDLSGR